MRVNLRCPEAGQGDGRIVCSASTIVPCTAPSWTRGRMLDHLVPAPRTHRQKSIAGCTTVFCFPMKFKRHQPGGTGFGNCVDASFTTGIRWLARSRTPSFRRKSFDVHVQFAACILLCMASRGRFRESRRSTRVPLKLTIAVEEDGTECLTCDGETIFVNLHGALISTAIALCCGTRISIHVYLTDKVAGARVVYVDPGSLLHCGIELDCPRNIWGVPLPPDDWRMDVETGQH